MEVPVGFVATCWSFISFLPFFFLLLILGLVKGLLICPIAAALITLGNSAVVIGLWPLHFLWTYYSIAKSKRLGWVLKILVLFALPLPLILWPFLAILGSILGGVAYGFFAPLIATFEALNVTNHKCYHCFLDGCYSSVESSCTLVRDFTDFCFHSYLSYMDEVSSGDDEENAVDIKLSMVPGCLLVSIVGVVVDVPLITAVALWKSPYMLFRGWRRLSEDMIGREGPFLETVCVPFAALAILLWPLAVAASLLAAFLSSFVLALYAGVIVHQEHSLGMGFAYIVAVISLFDEYANDTLYLTQGSCFPRPQYRRQPFDKRRSPPPLERGQGSGSGSGSCNSKLVSQGSKTLKQAIHSYTPVQVWDWLFKSCEVNGKMLLQQGFIDIKDFQDCMLYGNCKKLGIKLPAYSILHCLLTSARSDSSALLLSDQMELTSFNLPRDKVFEWFIGPLFTIKDQIKALQLQENEETCLKILVVSSNNDRPEDWDDTEFASSDRVRRAQLQAVIRRLQGIVGSMSRLPTFRRRFRSLVKVLYMEAIETGLLAKQVKGTSKFGIPRSRFFGKENQRDRDGASEDHGQGQYNMV